MALRYLREPSTPPSLMRYPGPNPYEAPGGQETHSPEERRCGVFPRSWSWRQRSLAMCSGVISISRPRHGVSAPHPACGAVPRAMVRAEPRGYGALRPRHSSVPSSRPRPSGGSTPRVGPCVSGAGERQHPWTGSDARRRARAGAEVPAPAMGAGPKRRGAPARALTPRDDQRPTCQAASRIAP
jgi:hypothetical protein